MKSVHCCGRVYNIVLQPTGSPGVHNIVLQDVPENMKLIANSELLNTSPNE